MRKIVIIAGPTAVGKTEYSLLTAEHFDGEIVSADSMQIYKYMDIGSAKPSFEELRRVKHYLIGEIDPKEDFTAAEYEKAAVKYINCIFDKEKLPLVTGGTGLYLNSLIYEMDFGVERPHPEFREKLSLIAEKHGGKELHRMLSEKNPRLASEIHPNNIKKLIRALERAEFSGENLKSFSEISRERSDYDVILTGLFREREELYDRINKRVDILVEKGLFNEVRSLLEMGLTSDSISMKGIGYKEIISYYNGEYSKDRAIELVKQNTRHYAKRQMTWLRRYKNMKWFSLSDRSQENVSEEIITYISDRLKTQL